MNDFIIVTFTGELTVGMLLKNQTAFVMDVQRHMNFDLAALHLLMNTTLPNRNLEVSPLHPRLPLIKPESS